MANKGLDITKEPLKDEQFEKIRTKMNSVDKLTDIYRAYKLIAYTGMHSRVLFPFDYNDDKTHIKEYNLHTSKDGKGRDVLVWDRPKKKGAKAFTEVLHHPEIDFDVDEFVKEIRSRASKYKRSTNYAHKLIKEVGEKIKVYDMSPLTLRHTLAVKLVKGGMNRNVVCDTLNIAPTTLRTYARLLTEDRHDEYAEAMGMGA